MCMREAMSDLLTWIWLASLPGLRAALRRALLDRFGQPRAVFAATERALLACGVTDEEAEQILRHDTSEAERILSRCGEVDVQILTMQDAAFPERLRNIPDPPVVLYVRGRLPAVDSEAVIAVVGTRKCSPYGEKMSRNIGYGIAKGGGIVVTGLAEGADSKAAEGALMAGGRVIGVLGTAINVVYPAWNGRLFDDVAATGALLSEYPPDAETHRGHFPVRNRIMAGLSLGVVVTEAPRRSGSLITASRAADYGRDVFAVPGNADAVGSRGSNALIRDGAKLVENAWDVLCEYENRFPDRLSPDGKSGVPAERTIPAGLAQEQEEKTEPGEGFFKLRVPTGRKKAKEKQPAATLTEQLEGLDENQLKIVGVMTKPGMHIDDIIDLSQLPAATVLSEMTLLQIKGYVEPESGKRFTLKVKKQ